MTTNTYGGTNRDLEWLFAAMMVSWGVYLLLPLRTFDAPQYTLLAAIADEKVWGVWSASIGVTRMVALWINGAVRQTPVIRIACAGLGAIWWAVLMWLFVTGGDGAKPAGVVWYPLFLLAELKCVLQSAGDAHIAGAFRRARA